VILLLIVFEIVIVLDDEKDEVLEDDGTGVAIDAGNAQTQSCS
jgi:hypothetical protein